MFLYTYIDNIESVDNKLTSTLTGILDNGVYFNTKIPTEDLSCIPTSNPVFQFGNFTSQLH